jgi:hypothetical protein
MHKMLLFILMSLFYMTLYALQTDQEIAMHTLFRGKHGLSAAVHAAAQQSDAVKLAQGVHAINEANAQSSAMHFLQTNLRLDANNDPLPGTFFRTRIEVLLFKVVNAQEVFPYTYTHPLYGYTVTLQKPGVIMFIRLDYPRSYSVLQPISWTLKAAAEMVY